MKRMVFLVGMFLGSNAFAVSMPELAVKKNCGGCHAVARKVVGPSFVDVANRYKGNREALVILTNKIQGGGSGIWGQQVMPRQSVTDGEARSLASFILGLSTSSSPVVLRKNDLPGKRGASNDVPGQWRLRGNIT